MWKLTLLPFFCSFQQVNLSNGFFFHQLSSSEQMSMSMSYARFLCAALVDVVGDEGGWKNLQNFIRIGETSSTTYIENIFGSPSALLPWLMMMVLHVSKTNSVVFVVFVPVLLLSEQFWLPSPYHQHINMEKFIIMQKYGKKMLPDLHDGDGVGKFGISSHCAKEIFSLRDTRWEWEKFYKNEKWIPQ